MQKSMFNAPTYGDHFFVFDAAKDVIQIPFVQLPTKTCV